MADCEFEAQLEAYLDGELNPATRASIERHLRECSSCAAELAHLRALTNLLTGSLAQEPEISQIALHRLHAKLDGVMDEGVIRTARILSAMAACVLVGCSLALVKIHEAPAPPPWIGASISTDSTASSIEASTPAAVWYLADANRGDENP